MEKWFIRNKKDAGIDFKKFGLSPILYKIILNRGIDSEEAFENYLYPTLDKLYSPILLPNMIKSANLIMQHIREKKQIRVVGDYDVDGVTSTYILVKGLASLGAEVDYDIPHRVRDGYGINKRIVEDAVSDGIRMLITCDNGIAAFDAISYAKEKGLTVIVTDHHEVAKDTDGNEILPSADGIINPKMLESKYPFKNICGCAVAFKLISYLYLVYGRDAEELYQKFLAYVAIATVCDVMPLIGENRILVTEGLKRINQSKDIGLCALIQACDLEEKEITVYHLGFILGPTINSSGRLESATEALALFMSENFEEAAAIAQKLRDYNAIRQSFTDEAFQQALTIIEKDELLKYSILVLYIPKVNESIVGIVAGRLKERLNRPIIVLTDSNGVLKGSGRSIEEYNMFQEISKFKEQLCSFGGHAMAAGISLIHENLDSFIVCVNKHSPLTKNDLVKKYYIDMELPLKYVTYQLIEDLKQLEPYGTENEAPCFGAKNLSIEEVAIFGKNKNVIKIKLREKERIETAILFEDSQKFLQRLAKVYGREAVVALLNHRNKNIKMDILYSPGINTFRGNTSIELKIKSYRVVGEEHAR